MVRGAAAFAFLLVLSIAYGAQDGDPASTGEPTESGSARRTGREGVPPLLAFNDKRAWRYSDGTRQDVFELDDGTIALALPGPRDGIVVQQKLETSSNILRVIGDDTSVLVRDAELFDVAVIGGAASLLYGRCVNAKGTREGEEEDMFVRELTSGRERSIGMSCGPEYGVARVSFGGDAFAVSAGCDLSECIKFVAVDGDAFERPSPTDDVPYNDPPYMRDATFSPDGKLLAYLEGPDSPGLEPEEVVGDWTLVVLEQPSGEERLRFTFAEKDRYVNRLDFDGRWAIVSFARGRTGLGQWSGIAEGEPGPVAAIDTTADAPAVRELGFDGVASIDE